jgi:poly(A) polymerase
MELLNLKPGRLVGEAYKHMLEIRMEQGPLDKEDAIKELMKWWQSKTE